MFSVCSVVRKKGILTTETTESTENSSLGADFEAVSRHDPRQQTQLLRQALPLTDHDPAAQVPQSRLKARATGAARGMENYFNYFTEVEEYFIRKRAKNLFVSPLDWCLIELWKDSGIPLNVALRGIDRGFETIAKRGKRPPRSLFYCHPAVLDAFEEHQQAMLGTSAAEGGSSDDAPEDEAMPRQQVQLALESLLAAVEGHEAEPFQRAAQRLSALIENLKDARQVGYERVDRELSEIGSALAQNLIGEMGSAELKELRREVRQETRLYGKHLEKGMMKRLQANYLHRKVLQSHSLPEFSLFSFSE